MQFLSNPIGKTTEEIISIKVIDNGCKQTDATINQDL